MRRAVKIVGIIVIVFIVLLAAGLYALDRIPVRQTKDYAVMQVDEGDVVDGDAILSPPEKYSQLLQIDVGMREKLAAYMKDNNYKLKCVKQEFVRNDPTLNELTEDLQFEKIDQ